MIILVKKLSDNDLDLVTGGLFTNPKKFEEKNSSVLKEKNELKKKTSKDQKTNKK